MRELGYDARDARLARGRVADQDLLAASLFDLRRKGSDELDHVQELVLLVGIRFLVGKRFDEIVVDEAGAEDVIAFGQHQLELFFGIRIEVDKLGRFGLDLHRMQKLAIHPKSERNRG